MEEARVVIDLKEGVIELQGPVDFVRHYLEMYQPTIKRLSREFNPSQEKPRRSSRGGRARRISCSVAIRNESEAGYFNELRSVSDIKQHLDESGFEFNDSNVRNCLKRLTNIGILNASGKGRGLRYSKPGL